MDEQSKNFNKEVENIRKYLIEVIDLRNIITELKNTIGFDSRLDKVEEMISKTEQWNLPNQSRKMKNS